MVLVSERGNITTLPMNTEENAEEQQAVQQIAATQAPRPPKKLKPARKQVKPGDVEKKETVQTGKEYSTFMSIIVTLHC